ncbi:MAG: TrmH family RNA methyltransferase [Candidatus Paceibacterota bacterium]
MKSENILVLHDIRSAQNVGAIFRTADACGISKIILSGYSPTPFDRFGRKRSDISKSALGAEESVAWEFSENIIETLKKLKEENFKIISIEQTENSVDYKNVKVGDKNIFVVGNEVSGVEKDILDISDFIVEIKMLGKKESLNVSVATGIALFGMLKI